jgi:hypothetical protein
MASTPAARTKGSSAERRRNSNGASNHSGINDSGRAMVPASANGRPPFITPEYDTGCSRSHQKFHRWL